MIYWIFNCIYFNYLPGNIWAVSDRYRPFAMFTCTLITLWSILEQSNMKHKLIGRMFHIRVLYQVYRLYFSTVKDFSLRFFQPQTSKIHVLIFICIQSILLLQLIYCIGFLVLCSLVKHDFFLVFTNFYLLTWKKCATSVSKHCSLPDRM